MFKLKQLTVIFFERTEKQTTEITPVVLRFIIYWNHVVGLLNYIAGSHSQVF